MTTKAAPGEGRLLFVLALAQFVTIIDFMMVMPLGPDFAVALGIDLGHLGWVGGAYTLAAAITGMLAAVHLDKFDRRTALLVSLSGLGIFTFLAGFAWNFESLLFVRFMSGVFGGPNTAICYAIIADSIPAQRRGAAMGKVMGAFSFASVLGVPFGLELSHRLGWHAPFFTSALSIALVVYFAWRWLAPMTGHLAVAANIKGFHTLKHMLGSRIHWMVFLYAGFGTFSAFLFIPNLAAYVQYNLHFPREELGWMYMAGGAVSFFILRAAGKIIDRTQAHIAAWGCALVLCFLYYFGFISQPAALPVMAIYILFMAASSLRNVSNNTLASRIPEPRQRAGFLALMASIAQVFGAAGAFASGMMLSEAGDKSLQGMDHVAWLALASTLVVPLLMWRVERSVNLRDKAAKLITPPEISV